MEFDRQNTIVACVGVVMVVAIIIICGTIANATADRKRVKQTELKTKACLELVEQIDQRSCLERL